MEDKSFLRQAIPSRHYVCVYFREVDFSSALGVGVIKVMWSTCHLIRMARASSRLNGRTTGIKSPRVTAILFYIVFQWLLQWRWVVLGL